MQLKSFLRWRTSHASLAFAHSRWQGSHVKQAQMQAQARYTEENGQTSFSFSQSPSQPFLVSSRNAPPEERYVTTLKTAAGRLPFLALAFRLRCARSVARVFLCICAGVCIACINHAVIRRLTEVCNTLSGFQRILQNLPERHLRISNFSNICLAFSKFI